MKTDQLKTEHAPRSWWTVIVLWFAGITAAMQFAKMSIGFEAFQISLGAGPDMVGSLLAACGFFGLIFGVSGASITAKFGFRKVLSVSLVAAAVISLVQAANPTVSVFYLTRLVEGATNLFIVVAAPVLIVHHAPPRHISSAMALWGTFYGVAFGVAGALGPYLLDYSGTAALLISHAAFALLTGVLLLSRSLREPSKKDVGSISITTLLRDNLRAIRMRRTLLPGLIFLFHSSIYLGLLIFVPLSAPSEAATRFLLVAMPLVSIVGTLLVGPLANSLLPPPRTLTIGFTFVIALSILLSWTENVAAYVAIAVVLTTLSGVVQGCIFILPSRLADSTEDEALAFGMIAQLGSLGSVVGPIAFAKATQIGDLSGFAILATILSISGLLVTVFGLGEEPRPYFSSKKVDTHDL